MPFFKQLKNFLHRPRLSVIVISYNMERELPRTLITLSPHYQQNISTDDYELIIVDNGSTQCMESIKCNLPSNAKFIQLKGASASPARAINYALGIAKGDVIGLCIDGARMLSPNLLNYALMATKLFHDPIVSTMAYHLGSEVQMVSVRNGYNQETEDKLLNSVDWELNGYRLFDISVFAGSSTKGWFMPIAESNAFFMSSKRWKELHGVDERFKTPGGGLVNLDTYKRAIEMYDNPQVISILGEGTFHQVHGGIATNQKRADACWQVFDEEYKKIRGNYFSIPEYDPVYLGKINAHHYKHLSESIKENLI